MSLLSKLRKSLKPILAPFERKAKKSVRTLTSAMKVARREFERATKDEVRENWSEEDLQALFAESLLTSNVLRALLLYFAPIETGGPRPAPTKEK
jgi:hypothetical protein